MKKLFLVLLFNSLTALPLLSSSAVHYVDIALSASGKPIAGAPVRVCNEPVTQSAPCQPLATVYSDVGLTIQKPNPFTADVLGNFDFYYDSSSGKKVSVEVSCQPGIPGCGPQGATNVTRWVCVFCGETMQVNDTFVATQPIFDFQEGTGIQLSGSDDPTNNRAKLLINSLGIPHNLLSTMHLDTVPFSPPNIGDLIRGNLNQLWEHQPVAQIGEVYTLIDVGGGQPIGEWVFPNTLDTCTSVQVNGVESGCEHELNFTGGNVTVVATDDSDNDRTNIAITAGGGGLTCDPNAITDLYVATTGNDTTGDGSIGNPWLTIQHAIDVGVPIFVGGKYYIHLAAGTYAENVTYTSRADCAGGIICGSIPPDNPFATGLSIIGSPDGVVSDTYIISGQMVVDGLKLYVQGVEITGGGVGITAQNHAQIALAAVHFYNNNLGLLVAMWSQAHLIPGAYVNDDFATALASADNFLASADGYEVTEDSVISDSCPDGNNTNLGTFLACDSNGTGAFGIACVEGKKGQTYLRGQLIVDYSTGVGAKGVAALDSHFAISRFTLTSTGIGTAGTAIDLEGGRMSGSAFGGGVYSITNAKYGVNLQNGAELADIPSITGSVTADYLGALQSQKGPTNLMTGSGYGVYVNQFSATPAFDVQLGSTHKITISNTVTSSTIVNAFDGANLTFQICQDGGGAHTFAWPADVLGADTIGATGSKCNVQRFTYDGIALKWYAIGPMQKNM